MIFFIQKCIKNTKFGPTLLIFCTLKLDTFTFLSSLFLHFLLNLTQFYNNVKKGVGIWQPYPTHKTGANSRTGGKARYKRENVLSGRVTSRFHCSFNTNLFTDCILPIGFFRVFSPHPKDTQKLQRY